MLHVMRFAAHSFTAALLLAGATDHLHASASTAYVTLCCNAPSTVGVFNASTLAHTRSIVTGSGGDSMALSPDGTTMYVTVNAARELQAIDIATGVVLGRVRVPIGASGEPPIYVAVSPDGSAVYLFAPQAFSSTLLMSVDTTTYKVTNIASLSPNQSEGGLLISPDGTQLYIEQGLSSEYIQVIDAASLTPTKQISINKTILGLAVTPSGLILVTDVVPQLLVIDPQSGKVVNRFSLPGNSELTPSTVISSPDSTTAYMVFGQSILALNLATGATEFDTAVAYSPSLLAISPDGNTLYSANYSSSNGAASISEFSIPAQAAVTTVRQLGPVSALALSGDGSTLYLLNAAESGIASVNMATDMVTSVSLGGIGLNSVAIAPNSGDVWASSYVFSASGDVIILDPSTAKLSFIAGPTGAVSFSPDGSALYVVNPGKLTVYSTASLKVIAGVASPNLQNFDEAIPSPDGKYLYVPTSFVSGAPEVPGLELFSPGDIAVFETSDYKRIGSYSVPTGLGAVALTPDGSTLVCTSNLGRVLLIDAATGAITATVHVTPVDGLLEGLALSPDGTTAYVTDAVNNLLVSLDLATQTQTSSVQVAQGPSAVATTPDGSQAWVATTQWLEIVDLSSGMVSGPVKLPGSPTAIAFGQ